MKNILIAILLLFPLFSFSQVGINQTNPDASAMLDIVSSDKGILIPRMANHTSVVSPAEGVMVFNTTTNSFWFYTGTEWKELVYSSGDNNVELTFGELYGSINSTIDLTDAGVYYGWVSAVEGGFSKVTFTDNAISDRMTISNSGTYRINVTISFSSTKNTHAVTGKIFKNGVGQDNIMFKRMLNSNGDVGSAALTGILTLSAGDYIDLRFSSDTNTKDMVIEALNFNIMRIK